MNIYVSCQPKGGAGNGGWLLAAAMLVAAIPLARGAGSGPEALTPASVSPVSFDPGVDPEA